MKFLFGSRSDIGRARERNEDALLIQKPMFVVADGMGGHRGGDVASALAIEVLRGVHPEADDDVAKTVAEGIRTANRTILERGEADRALRGMGTTLTAFVTDGDKAHLAHVGDSRAYLLRDGHLQQLSEDHTLVQRMVHEGKLRPEEAATHPQRNILTRVLGGEEPLEVDLLTLDVHPGDRLMLCSDGLTNMLHVEDIKIVLETERDPQAAADALVEAANRAGGDDNITVIVVDVLEGEDEPARPVTEAAAAPTGTGSPEVAPDPAQITGAMPALDAEEERPEEVTERHGRRRGRIVVWTLLVLALVAAGLFGARAYVDHQWYVGEDNGQVAIYNGIPSTVAGFHLSHVAQRTDLSAAAVGQLRTYGDLKSGITTNIDNLADAQALVTQMRQDLARNGTAP